MKTGHMLRIAMVVSATSRKARDMYLFGETSREYRLFSKLSTIFILPLLSSFDVLLHLQQMKDTLASTKRLVINACRLKINVPLLFQICPSLHCSLLPPLLHGQNLYHTDEDVDEIELEGDGFVDGVASEHASFGHARMSEDFLGVVESEAAEDSQSVHLISIDALFR